MRADSGHKKLTLGHVRGVQKEAVVKRCPFHRDEVVKLYCTKCDKLVCLLDCHDPRHADHKMEPLEVAGPKVTLGTSRAPRPLCCASIM